jgi:hypothetical protein
MSSFPELHELIWLFESEPTIPEEYPGWPIIPATFETERGPWRVRCVIAPYDYTVTIRCQIKGEDAIEVNLLENVDEVKLDRTHDAEALVVVCRAGSLLRPVRLQLKPRVHLVVETELAWQSPQLPLCAAFGDQ